jgi:hypothetical protein
MVVATSCCGDVFYPESLVAQLALRCSALDHCATREAVWGCFSAEGKVRLVQIEGKMNGVKYKEILDENLLQIAEDLRLG